MYSIKDFTFVKGFEKINLFDSKYSRVFQGIFTGGERIYDLDINLTLTIFDIRNIL